MEKVNDEVVYDIDSDVASEEITNFIDELIVKRLVEKIEQQKASADSTLGKLSEIESSIEEIKGDSNKGNRNTQVLLKLLFDDPYDLEEVVDCEEQYTKFDLVKHSSWEKEQIEKIINESFSQKIKTQEILRILLNQKKEDKDFQSDEYYCFDIVEKINLLENRISNLAEYMTGLKSLMNSADDKQKAIEERVVGILIKNENDTVPEYFEKSGNSIKRLVKDLEKHIKSEINVINVSMTECQRVLSVIIDNCTQHQQQIQDIKNKSDEVEQVQSKRITDVRNKVFLMGGFIIAIQIISIILSFFV